MSSVAFVLGIVAVLIMMQLYRMTSGFRIYTSRPSQRQLWLDLFPLPEHQHLVESMLEGFCRSFLFSAKAKWCFRPDDQISQVLADTDTNRTDHLQYDMFQVVLSDMGLNERPQLESVDLRTVAELLIAARYG